MKPASWGKGRTAVAVSKFICHMPFAKSCCRSDVVGDAFRVPNPSLPLPVGEVSERSEDGEGNKAPGTLSVTFGDSSPKGGAKGQKTEGRRISRA